MMIDEKILQFVRAEIVFVKDNGAWKRVKPCSIDLTFDNMFRVSQGALYWNVEDFSLEIPKRVFEDGAMYPVKGKITDSPFVAQYRESIGVFRVLGNEFPEDYFTFIGEKLSSKLWEVK